VLRGLPVLICVPLVYYSLLASHPLLSAMQSCLEFAYESHHLTLEGICLRSMSSVSTL